ncbi:hypothetical protein LAG90_15505 [Marinilongibacter aquaticus]|uniref:hypothetical protein n=1 Tax=Marinilongibacter aquaticus TaxID=2975157 RepID=UPI0021BD72C1|nr:hypothetical protein [Marinilongibacter aquaticus]UBM58209.1 hypothetical protein LAG90_15505 [Marinilongibacter aquaticus]
MAYTMEDIARLRVELLGDDAEKSIDSLSKGVKDLKSQLTLLELEGKKNSEEWREIKTTINDATAAMKEQAKAVDVNNASMNELVAYRKTLNSELRKQKIGSKEWLDTMAKLEPVNQKLAETNKAIRSTGNEVESQKSTWSNLKSWIAGAFAITAILAFGRKIIEVGKQIFDITAKFEAYDTTLKNMLGSQQLATSAMEMIKTTAATTNWSVDELTDSFIKLKSRGVLPTSRDITAISDFSNYLKKDFGQVVEAIQDINNTERWNEIGVKAQTTGNKVSLTFNGVTETVDRTEKGVLSAINKFGQMNGVMGLTADISEGLAGKQSNLGDKIDFIAVSLGEKLKPIFHFVLDMFLRGSDIVSEFIEKSGPLSVFAQQLAKYYNILLSEGSKLFYDAFPSFRDKTFDMGTAVKVLASILNIIPSVLLTVVAGIKSTIQFFELLGQGAKVVGNFITGDFATAGQAATRLNKKWIELKDSASESFGDIRNSFIEIWKDQEDIQSKATMSWDDYVASQENGQKKITKLTQKELDKRKKAAEKEAKEKEKLLQKEYDDTRTLIKKMDAAWADSIEDELERNKIKLMQKYEDELESIEKSEASEEVKAKFQKELKGKLLTDIQKLEEEDRKKRAKSQKEWTQKVQGWEFDQKKKLLEDTIEAEELNGKKRYDLRKDLLKLIYRHENEQIEKWKSDQLEAAKDNEEKKEQIEKLANAKKLEAVRNLNNASAKLDKEAREEISKNRDEYLAKGIIARRLFNKEIDLLNNEELKQVEDKLKKQLALRKEVGDKSLQLFGKILDKMTESMDEESKIIANGFKNMLSALAKGDYVAAAFSIIEGVVDTIFLKMKQEQERLQNEIERSKQIIESMWNGAEDRFNSFSSAISSLSDIYGTIYTGNESIEEQMQSQLEIMDEIISKTAEMDRANGVEPYTKLIEAEVKYANLVKANYEEKKRLEDEFFNKAIANINARYDYESLMANQQYDADTLALLESQSEQLLALINNEESKTSVMSEYAAKRSQIMQTFALADMEITSGMDQAQIDAINAARDARAKALADLQNWYNSELEFIVNNEGQKRKEYSETEKIQNEINDRLELLAIEKKAADIQRELDRNSELESEAARHNAELQRLGEEKDAALAASFERMKDLMIAGYEDIRNAAFKAYQQGIITAEQLNNIMAQLNQINALAGSIVIPSSNNNSTSNSSNTNTGSNSPRGFGSGGIIPQGALHSQGGITLWDNLSNRPVGEIEGGEPILSRATYANNKDLVDSLLTSSMHMKGAKISRNGNMMNYASPNSFANGGLLPNLSARGNNQDPLVLELLSKLLDEMKQSNAHTMLLEDIRDKPPLSLHEINAAVKAQYNAAMASDF